MKPINIPHKALLAISALLWLLIALFVLTRCSPYTVDESNTTYRRLGHSRLYRKVNSTDKTDYVIVGKLKKIQRAAAVKVMEGRAGR